MLAYYTSLIKREEVVKKLSEDGNDLASLTNDLVCELKIFTSACNNRDVETCLDSLSKASELSKVVTAMISNVESNYKSYVSSLLPQSEQLEQKSEQKPEESPVANEKDIPSIFEAIKTLKEMKDSLGQ